MLNNEEFQKELKELKELRLQKAQLEGQVKEVNGEIAVKVRDLVEHMDATEQLSVKVKGFGTASLTTTKFYGIDREEPRAAESFEQWMREKGDWELVTAVHASKLQGYYKERLELNEELPPGVKTSFKNNIVIRGL